MGLFDFLKPRKQQEPIVVQKGIDPAFARMLYNHIGKAPVFGEDNFQNFVEKGYQYNADVYSIVNLITRKAATAPPILYEVIDERAFQKYKSFTQNISKPQDVAEAMALRQKALVEVSEDHPIIKTLLNPNDFQSYYEFMDNFLGFKLITGNSYIYGVGPVTGNNAGKFKQLYVLPAHLVRIVSEGRYSPVSGYTLTTVYDTQELDAPKVLHSKYWNPDYSTEGSHLYGQSPLRAAMRVLQQSNDAQTASVKLFQNTGAMGILYDASEDNQLSPEQAYELQRKWDAEYGKNESRGKVIISASKIGWQQIGLSPVDLAIIDSMKMNLRQLCNVYRVNSALMNDPDNKTYNNMYEARKALISDAILPELIAARADLNKWLVAPYNKSEGRKYFLDFDLSVFPELQEDKKEQIQYLERAWWLTPNQKLEEMGYGRNPNPLMDNIYVSIQVTPIDKLNIDPIEQAAAIAQLQAPAQKSATLEEKAETYNDYPDAAVNNAKRALKWKEENGSDCGTPVGWKRANQLANRERISRDTIARMASFKRHQQYKDVPYEEGCGGLMWDAWGGSAGIEWAIRKLKEIDNN